MMIRLSAFKTLTAILFAGFALSACKKTDPMPAATGGTSVVGGSVATGTRAQLTLDSIFLYAKETYLWYDALPTYEAFNPRQYTTVGTDPGNFQKELFDITQYKINPLTNLPYEYSTTSGSSKYSYMVVSTGTGGKTSSVSLEGVGDDFGIAFSSVGANDIRIRYVSPGSSGAAAGIARGHRLVKINGTAVRADSQSDINLINAAFSSSTMTLLLEKPDKSTYTVTLTAGSYKSSPVYKKAILTAGTAKVGYLNFGRFSTLTNAQSDLDAAFADFSAAGVANLIIDLRYNGGGYVNTQEYFANLIATSSMTGSLMYTEHFNALMVAGKAPILSKQVLYDANNKVVITNGRTATYADIDYSVKGNTYNFSKKGSLNTIKNIYFIVSGNTASASELLINNLKPYFNVKLIGSKTYGKPVGFFSLKIDKYDVFMSQFQSFNSAGVGDFFDGMTVDFAVADDVTHDFGDVAELCINKALSLISTTVATASVSTMSVNGQGAVSSAAVDVQEVSAGDDFKGMVENRRKLKE